MVHHQQRRLLGTVGQRRFEPAQLFGPELTAVFAGDRAVEHDQPERTDVDAVADGIGVLARKVEGSSQGAPVVVVARDDAHRSSQTREFLADQRVLFSGCVVGEIAGDDDRVGQPEPRPYRLDRGPQTREGVD